jgi:hypothetical protein
MATIKLKRGSGVPSGLAAGEPAMDTATGRVYISKDGSSVVEVGSTALDSNVSNNLTVGNNATVSGNTTLNTVTVNGLSSLSSVDATSLQTTGSMIAGDLYSNSNALISGSVTAASGSITNNLTVGGTVSATGGNSNNWNAAYSSRPTNLTFSTSNGVLTLQKGTGTETVDLDGRYLTMDNGVFTPVVTDQSGNTASLGQYYAAYSKIRTSTSNTDPYQIWFMMSLGNINTSGLVGTDQLRIVLPAAAAYTVPVAAQNILVTYLRGTNLPSARDAGAQISGFPDTNNSSNTAFRLQSVDENGDSPVLVSELNSGNNALVMSGWII